MLEYFYIIINYVIIITVIYISSLLIQLKAYSSWERKSTRLNSSHL